MKFLKSNLKVIIAFILGLILAGGIAYAAVSASQIEYTTNKNANVKTVEDALNDLYIQSNTTEEIIYPYIFGSGNAVTAYFKFSDIRNKKIYIDCRETNNLDNVSTANIYIGNSLNGNTWTKLKSITGNNELDVEGLINTYSISVTTQPYLIFYNTDYNGYSIAYAK